MDYKTNRGAVKGPVIASVRRSGAKENAFEVKVAEQVHVRPGGRGNGGVIFRISGGNQNSATCVSSCWVLDSGLEHWWMAGSER